MSIADCHISINRTIAVDYQAELNDPKFIELARQCLIRDGYKCSLCGFTAVKNGQQVVTKNGHYKREDFRLDNLTTVCPYCFLGQRLGHSALTDELTFIYCPELSQAAINNMLRQIYFYEGLDTPEHDPYETLLPPEIQGVIDMKEQSSVLLSELRERVSLVSKQFDYCSLSHLKNLTGFLFDLDEESYKKRNLFFKNVRYLIKPSTLIKYNETYSKTVFSHLNGYKELEMSKSVTVIDKSLFNG